MFPNYFESGINGRNSTPIRPDKPSQQQREQTRGIGTPISPLNVDAVA